MNTSDEQLHEDIGYIKSEIKNIHVTLKEFNGDMKTIKKDVARHDIVFGKIGVVITVVIFAATTAVTFVVDIIRDKLRG